LATAAEQDAFRKLHRPGTLSETLSGYTLDISWAFYRLPKNNVPKMIRSQVRRHFRLSTELNKFCRLNT
jgi:hypothetical protein